MLVQTSLLHGSRNHKICVTRFIVIYNLLRWSRTELTLSPRYACSVWGVGFFSKDFFCSSFTDTKDVFGRIEMCRASGREVIEQGLTFIVKTDPGTVQFPVRLLQTIEILLL